MPAFGGKADVDHRPAEGPITRLGDVAEAMVKGGTWGQVEMGSFGAVGQYIATGDVSLGPGLFLKNAWKPILGATHRRPGKNKDSARIG